MDNDAYVTPGYGLKSVTGPRALNEDSAFIKEYISRARQQRYMCMAAVADGMGGHQAGEVASSAAVQSLFEEFNAQKITYDRDPYLDTRQLLYQLFSLVNTTVYDIARRDNKLKGMGTTLTVFLAEGDKAYVAHVGDSRAYLIRGGSITQVTEDHTLVQDMVRDKIITREQAGARSDRNVITRAIGVDATVEVDVISFPIQTGDILFLCSDGLYGVVGNHEILITLTRTSNLQLACQDLVQRAMDNGASDNISAVAWAVPDIPWGQPQTVAARPAKTPTGTVVLPPEREYTGAAQRSPGDEGRSNKIVLAIIFAAVIIAGFILGWLIAGWVEGGGEEPKETTVTEQGAKEEETATETDTESGLTTSLHEDTAILILNSPTAQGEAEAAAEKLKSLGYKDLDVGRAERTTETTVYCKEDFGEMVNILVEDLGMKYYSKEFDTQLVQSKGADIIVVLAPGWDGY